MKRNILLLLLLTLTTSGLMAQRKVSFAVDAGADISTFLMTPRGGERLRTPFSLSPSLTGRIDLKLGNSDFYLSSGLSYYAPRSSQDLGVDKVADALRKAGLNIDWRRLGSFQERMTTHYLSLPLLLGSRTVVSADGKLSFAGELGFRFSIGLGGSLSYTLYDGSRNKLAEASVPIFSSRTNGSARPGQDDGSSLFLPASIGFQAAIRAEYGRYYLRVGMDQGLTNINRFSEGSRITIFSLSTTLGVRF
jgi:hypothetical protein